jgi:starch synthase (maltosyl-transferring)
VRDFFRANLWPNTPDILHAFLQHGGRPAFMSRLILAATLGANYGIYGPAFELCENRPLREGSEEYLNSEKYQIRVWDLNDPITLKPLITKVNQIRRASKALQSDRSLIFHPTDNDELIAYSKVTDDLSDKILVVVNLDPFHTRAGFVNVILKEFALASTDFYEVEDLLSETRYTWHGSRNYVELRPFVLPAHIFRVRALK